MEFTWQASSHSAKGTYGTDGYPFETKEGTWAIFRMFDDADKTPASGKGEFEWNPRVGKADTPQRVNGKPVTVRLELDMTGPPVFQKNFLSRLACVSEVAKP
jgi:type VI protein secretion system component VasK